MSSIAGGSDEGGFNEEVEGEENVRASIKQNPWAGQDDGTHTSNLEEELADIPADTPYIEDDPVTSDDNLKLDDDDVPTGYRTPPNGSPADSGSIPDDTPSIQGSQVSLPLRGTPSPRGSISRTPSGALQPFERRFQSRFSASPSPSPRTGSPAYLNAHSRQSSIASQVLSQGSDVHEAPQQPWEVVRWTRLRKITGQAFSEVGKRQFGSPTCLAVSASIIIGTSKGLILVFDYHQTLKSIIGQGTKATECGAITSLALAADYSTVAGGHASGNMFTWELAHPARPFLHIPPVPRSEDQNSDGHVPGRAVMHIGFLGTRHTALVSADDCGMAFSHLATRGLGAVARTVKTTRLLGRYPAAAPQTEANRKPSSVLAFAPLPLGNVEQATDTMGLSALLTPYLLVIVSTTPIAQTQHKAGRPKEVTPHSAMSGCLAWFPAVKLKLAVAGRDVSSTKLVYCWSDVLTVLDVEIGPQDPNNKDKQPSLFFHPRARWKCEEAIVAVQWLSRSVIGVLTISQRLIIIEDGSLNAMDSVDLLQKHIYHQDVFSKQLHPVVEQSENESSMHGVIADAFYMSFRVYKGRLFMLGFSDISVGTVSNWADRITALVENGDDIAAIRLGQSFYAGSNGKVSVGLPEDAQSRHELVREKMLELMTASLNYRFSDTASEDGRLRELTTVCFDACVSMDEQSFLLDDAYDLYRDAGEQEMFLDMLESYIMDEEIKALPPTLVKDLVDQYVLTRRTTQLEELLCRLEAHTFDPDQITKLCKRHLLYDALIYVWNQALGDWLTPLVELVTVVRDVHTVTLSLDDQENVKFEAAMKLFPYLAYSLTGRIYPKGEPMNDEQADVIKRELYKFLFSDQATHWPPESSATLHTRSDGEDEPAFPYLHLLLEFDTANFMSMLNEAFEDPFLNTNQDMDGIGIPSLVDSGITNGTGVKITRQHIVSILLEIMSNSDFTPEQTIFLDMFIARSLPKYSQFMVLSGSSLQQILRRLCTPPSRELSEDCQLSAEYLLSVYHPSVTPGLIELLKDAEFYRVLKSIYRSEHQCINLIQIYFEDPSDRQAIFGDITNCLRQNSSAKQRPEIEDLLCAHATEMAFIDLSETARTLSSHAPDILGRFLDSLGDSRLRFAFLRTLLESSLSDTGSGRVSQSPPSDALLSGFCEQYVQLMCEHDPAHVADYVSVLKSGDLKLDRVLPTLEENGVIDAAVLLLAQDGLARDAMDRLVKHMHSLENALCSLIHASAESPDVSSTEEAAGDLVEAVEKYSRLGVWLCRGQTEIANKSRRPRPRTNPVWEVKENELDLDEYLWLTLIDLLVSVAKNIGSEASDLSESSTRLDTDKITNSLRALVQQVFTALLSTTAAPTAPSQEQPTANEHDTQARKSARLPTSQSFLHIFRAFLTRATLSAPSLTDLRAALLDIFEAYAYESDVLSLASSLLGKDVFTDVAELHKLRQRGWRPRAQVCETCKRRAWGSGVGEGVWDAWVGREEGRERKRRERLFMGDAAGIGNGKGKSSVPERDVEEGGNEEERKKLALVVFACRHVFHRSCLDEARERVGVEDAAQGRYKCPLCDGDERD